MANRTGMKAWPGLMEWPCYMAAASLGSTRPS